MTKLLTTVALVALIASPALAAKAPRHGKLLLQAAPAAEASRDSGWDPDPNVRLMLRKDAPNFY